MTTVWPFQSGRWLMVNCVPVTLCAAQHDVVFDVVCLRSLDGTFSRFYQVVGVFCVQWLDWALAS